MIGSSLKKVRRVSLATAVAVVVLVLVTGFAGPADSNFFFKINKSIDVFGRVYREIALNYVDEVDPEKFMEAGIEGMLGTLDPYTVYIDKEDGDEVELLTSGRYGGIGVTIGVRDGNIQVITVMDGYSAQRQGIRPGDKILEVDGKVIGKKKPDEVRGLTRGEPGTEVKVLVEREGESKPVSFVLVREEIQIKNVSYAGFVGDGIGYIRLERFSRKAGDEVRQAITDLKLQGVMTGLILDVRGNPGGLLDAAVEIVGKFVPRGSLIVSTKGRRPDAEKEYRSVEEPILPDVPLIVLTDRNSASASEIVAGSLQDLDRALVVGTRTFGKGLVQTIMPLNYGAQLKLTTARYYIPSGRSIQEIDYIHRDRSGMFVKYADSLKEKFRTASGRPVFEHGGVTPDSVIDNPEDAPMVRQLHRKSLFFKFVNTYVSTRPESPGEGVTVEVLEEFKKFLEDQKFDYQDDTNQKVDELLAIAGQRNYSADFLAELNALKKSLEGEKLHAFDRYRNDIRSSLEVELMARLKGETGRIEASLRNDLQLKTGVSLLKTSSMYTEKLRGNK